MRRFAKVVILAKLRGNQGFRSNRTLPGGRLIRRIPTAKQLASLWLAIAADTGATLLVVFHAVRLLHWVPFARTRAPLGNQTLSLRSGSLPLFHALIRTRNSLIAIAATKQLSKLSPTRRAAGRQRSSTGCERIHSERGESEYTLPSRLQVRSR